MSKHLDEPGVIRILQALVTLPGVHYSVVASASGVAPATVRYALATGRLPTRPHARKALVDFAERNAEARERRELVFV